MDLIKLLDLANPKKVKDTINNLITDWYNFEQRVDQVANYAEEVSTESLANSESALSIVVDNEALVQESKRISDEALTIVEQADARSEEAALLAENAFKEASDAFETSELANNIAIAAKSAVDDALRIEQLGTIIRNTADEPLIRTHITEDSQQQDAPDKVYIASPNAIRTNKAVIFSEIERQKSKNLAFWKLGSYNIYTGAIVSNNNRAYCDFRVISDLPYTINIPYSRFRYALIFDDYNKIIGAFSDLTFVKREDSFTFTPHTNGIIRFLISNDADSSTAVNINEFNNTIQIEQGTEVTSFQPHRGAITHNGDAPVTFAEREYQKSKNLFDNSNTSYNVINNGSLEKTGTGFIAKNPNQNGTSVVVNWYQNLKANKTYAISFRLKFETAQTGHYPVFRINGTIVLYCKAMNEYLQYSYIFTPETDGDYKLEFICSNNQAQALSSDITYVENFQIEEGIVATSYQSYNGAITHNGDAPVVFAERERQKSKNLFNIISGFYNVGGGITTTISDNKITIDGTCTSGSSKEIPITPIKCKANTTYVFSVNNISGTHPTTGNFTLRVGTSGGITNAKFLMSAGQLNSYVKYTPIEDVTLDTLYIVYNEVGLVFSNYNFNIMFEQNTDKTDYQPYNGAIVHEKDIEEDILYDINGNNTIGGVPYSSGVGANLVSDTTLNGGEVTITANYNLEQYKRVIVVFDLNGRLFEFSLARASGSVSFSGGGAVYARGISNALLFFIDMRLTNTALRFEPRTLSSGNTEFKVIDESYVKLIKMSGVK